MKSFVCFIYLIVVISLASATTVGSSSGSSSLSSSITDTKQDVESELKPLHTSQLTNEYNRFRKSAGYGGSGGGYGAASIPAPPCPKNYLFSCQPNLAPVPCAAPAPAYGSAGGYSAPVPTFIAPLGNNNNYGVPQGYSGFVPQTFNQFYQY